MIHLCIDSRHVLYITETLMPEKENNAEWRESFILKQTYFSVNNYMQWRHAVA
jgi:hypothetical protein